MCAVLRKMMMDVHASFCFCCTVEQEFASLRSCAAQPRACCKIGGKTLALAVRGAGYQFTIQYRCTISVVFYQCVRCPAPPGHSTAEPHTQHDWPEG